MPKVRDGLVGPHEVVLRVGGLVESRPDGAGLSTRRANAPQQAQVGHQVQAEKGNFTLMISSLMSP